MRIQPLWEKQTIYQGATWQPSWVVLDGNGDLVDLTACTARCVIGSTHGTVEPLSISTTENGGVVLSSEGEVSVYITAENTSALPATSNLPAYFEVELLEPGGEPVHRLVYGPCVIDPEVKKDYE